MQAVLMVAGKSTRTYPLTLTRPKPLLPILNKALIKHSLDQLTGLFETVIFITGYRQDMIKAELGDSYNGIKLVYQEQKRQLGTGHAVLQAKSHIEGPFVAMNGDDLFSRQDIEALLQYDYAALAKKVDNPELYGVFEIDGADKVRRLVEKPKTFIGDLANIGCYVLQPDFFPELEKTPPSERGEIEITSAVNSMAQKREVYTVAITGFWLPTGFAWDLLSHQEYLMRDMQDGRIEGHVEEHVTLKGGVHVGSGTVLKSGTYIEGPVIIGRNCTIGPNCTIRGCTSIGDGSIIGQAVEIKNSILFPDVLIKHLSYIGDSVIGQGAVLGAGTITANHRHDDGPIFSNIKSLLVNSNRTKFGAIISDAVKTGIQTSIYPGRKIWPEITTLPGAVISKDLMPPEFTW